MKTNALAKPDKIKVGTAPRHLAAIELSEILRVSKRAVIKRSSIENWPCEEVQGNGGIRKLFPVSTLPPDIRKKVRIHFGDLPAEFAECVPAEFDQAKVKRCSQEWDSALDWQKERARARLEILNALDRHRVQSKKGRRAALDQFVELYRTRQVLGVEPSIYDQVEKISRSQLYEWENAFRENGIAGLISKHGHTRGQTKIPLEQQKFIVGWVAKNPSLRPSHLAESLRDKFNGSTADRRQIAGFLKACREKDPAVFCFLNNPDDYKSRYELAWGDNTEKALHFLHYVEVDSSPADVICADGKRHTIIGLIDIFSRKAKFIVTKTSNSWAIAGVIRSTIVDWGVPENLVRDNGRDYDSKLVNEGLQALQINVVNVPPFTPNAKPCIERVFRTLAHMLFEKLPGYCGHNVAERKAIEARKSFVERFMKRGEKIEMGLTPEELQAVTNAWVEKKYHQREHGTLRVSPNAKAASVPVRPRRIEDPRSLDILLAPAPGSTVRNVGKKGIHLDNQLYVGDCLIDWTGRDVLVRLDIRDAGRIFLFDPKKKTFIGEAFDPAISGITVGDKIAAKKRAKKRVMEKVKALKTLAQEAGDPITDNPFVTAANAAASSVRESEKSATERFFEEEAFALAHVPERISEDPKVVRFPGKDHSQPHPEIRYFANPLERFRWLIAEQRNRSLLPEELDWVARNRDAWQSFVRAFAKDWPESDRGWLRPIAPDLFEALEFQGGI